MRKYVLGLTLVLLFGFMSCNQKGGTLPVFQPQLELVDSTGASGDHIVLPFNLVNQNGDVITENDYRNKIYVVDFFFTRCTTICPIMSSNIAKIQDAYQDDRDVKFLSVSVTPDVDSVSVLKEYAERYKIKSPSWNFTTGNKKHIYNLARKSYFVALDEGDGGLQDFIHTSQFVLVDPDGHIRGYYDGVNNSEIENLITDIKLLKEEF